MDCTMERRVAVILHNTVDKVLAVYIECCRSTFSLHYAPIGLLKTECDETTAMIG